MGKSDQNTGTHVAPETPTKMLFGWNLFAPLGRLPKEGIEAIPTKLIPFILFFVKQIWGQIGLTTILFSAAGVIYAFIPYLISQIVRAFETAPNTTGGWTEYLHHLMPSVLIFLGLLNCAHPILYRIGARFSATSRAVLTNLVRRQLSLYVDRHDITYFQNEFSGRISGKVLEMPDALAGIVASLVDQFLYTALFLIVFIAQMAFLGWPYAVIIGVWILIYVCILCLNLPKINKLSEVQAGLFNVVRGRYIDRVANILPVKLFALPTFEDKYLTEALAKDTAGYARNIEFTLHTLFYMRLTLLPLWGSLIAYMVYQWKFGDVQIADVLLVFQYTSMLVDTALWISFELTTLFERAGTVQDGIKTLIVPHGMVDADGAADLHVKQAAVSFDRVRFQYGSLPVVRDFSLEIKSGEKIGLVGMSGAGKSTLVNLLLRLYDIQGGTIAIDGQDISKVSRQSLRHAIAMIPQSSELFHRSLMDNIRYGKLDASDAEVFEAARKARADEFIRELVDKDGNAGYAAMVGERGVKLSGGQRQRIAIARAILKNAPILVLDEATSALDSESEHLIQESLKDLMVGKTVIAIAHRLSTISHLDRLIIMDEGRIIEEGSHKDLLAHDGGLYAKLWGMQSGGFIGG